MKQSLIRSCAAFAVFYSAFISSAFSETDIYAGVATVEVFANMAMTINSESPNRYKLNIYRLDAMQGIEEIMNRGLPQNETDATVWIKNNEQRLKREIQPMVASAANGMALAKKYEIDRIPAIVVNQRYVVFGYTSVDDALTVLAAQRNK